MLSVIAPCRSLIQCFRKIRKRWWFFRWEGFALAGKAEQTEVSCDHFTQFAERSIPPKKKPQIDSKSTLHQSWGPISAAESFLKSLPTCKSAAVRYPDRCTTAPESFLPLLHLQSVVGIKLFLPRSSLHSLRPQSAVLKAPFRTVTLYCLGCWNAMATLVLVVLYKWIDVKRWS